MRKSSAKDNGAKVARVYIRVSHQGERGKGPGGGEFLSPDLQLNEAKKYADLYLKDCIFDEAASVINADIDTSASRIKWQKRAGLVAHLEAARRGEFNALIVFKPADLPGMQRRVLSSLISLRRRAARSTA